MTVHLMNDEGLPTVDVRPGSYLDSIIKDVCRSSEPVVFSTGAMRTPPVKSFFDFEGDSNLIGKFSKGPRVKKGKRRKK